MSTAAAANEQTYRNGYDLCLEAELSDFAERDAEDEERLERLEREGRAEMYYTLFGEWAY